MTFKCRCDDKECIGGIVYFFKTKDMDFPETSSPAFVPLSLRECHFESKEKIFGKEDIVMQYYENEEQQDVEANYALPIERKADAILFEAEVGGKRICKVVKDASGCCNGILKATCDLMPNRNQKSNMFQTRLGLLKPGSGVKISLKYVSSIPELQVPQSEYPCRKHSMSKQSILSGNTSKTIY